jgi:hypothetical protein
MKMTVFWDVAPCSLVEVDRRFRGAYCLHIQGDISEKAVSFILAVRTWQFEIDLSSLLSAHSVYSLS